MTVVIDAISDGVNVAGYLTAEVGVGVAARGYVRALQNAGIPVALNNVDIGVSSRKGDDSFGEFAQNNPYPVNLICVNAHQLPEFIGKYGADYFKGKYNIGVWWWELQEFPQIYWQCFPWLDEIWVGSSFIQQALSRYSPIPVVFIPPSVSLPEKPLVGRAELSLPQDEFLFLFMFDFLSTFERKNPLALLEAFRRAFTPDQPVRLILKCINSDKEPAKLAQVQKVIDGLRVTLLDEYLSPLENISLSGACDAYVSLHRSEGLGLPLAEAMMLRKPVIGTGWSGNTDFMTASNSYPLPYKLVANPETVGPYLSGEMWADADVEAAADAMREVFNNRVAAELKAAQAVTDATTYFSPVTIGAKISSRLAAVQTFRPDMLISRRDAALADGVGTKDSLGAPPNERKVPSKLPMESLVQEQLDIISGIATASGASAQAKGLLRKFVMPIVERAGYLNTIYASLFKKLFESYGNFKARIDLVDDRTRRSIADQETRIRALEAEIERLRR